MSTRLKHHEINSEYAELLSFKSQQEEREHNAQMVSFRILSEVEKICAEKKIKKKELATMVGTSASYITQLFRGDKQINTDMMARFEEALDTCFEIKMRYNEQTHSDFLISQLSELNTRRVSHKQQVWYCMDIKRGGADKESMDDSFDTLESMNTKQTTKQIA